MTARRPSAHLRLISAALGAVCLLAVASPPAKAEPVLGFTTTGYRHPGSPSLSTMAQFGAFAGARIMRLEIRWAVVEPKADAFGNPVTTRWHQYDRAVAALRAAGIRPILLLSDAPEWADGPLGVDTCNGIHCPPDATHRAQWADFARRVAKHYRHDAVGIEIWNAPNTAGWWPTPGGPNPQEYARLVETAARAIHRASPGMPVLFGSVGYLPRRTSRRYMTIPTFLRRFYKALDRGALRRGDGLSFHPYPAEGELGRLNGQFARIIRQVTQVRDARDRRRLLWVTETGVSTTGPNKLPERAQARGLLNVIDHLSRRRDIAAAIIHTLVEVPKGKRDRIETGYGVMRRGSNGKPLPKAAYCALARLAGTPEALTGCPPPPPPGRCTIRGSKWSEILRGTPGPDVICGGRGNDVIRGLGEGDVVTGGRGRDTLIGGAGADKLVGGEGHDHLDGGPGPDTLRGGPGRDQLHGGGGEDDLGGGPGRDDETP